MKAAMKPLSPMWTQVLLATVISTLDFLIIEHLSSRAFAGIPEFPLPPSSNATSNATISASNTPAIQTANPARNPHNDPFYLVRLPRHVIELLLIYPLEYLWQLWLERTFPIRPRGVQEQQQLDQARAKKEGLTFDEDKEEEIVQRWIAQGKARRASISWCNTIVKYLLDLIVGRLWMSVLQAVIGPALELKGPATIVTEFKSELLFTFLASFLTITVWTSFIGFLIVPAPQRIVLNATANLLWAIFIGSFLNLTVPWLMGTKFMQDVLSNNGTFHQSLNQTHNVEWKFEKQGPGGVELR